MDDYAFRDRALDDRELEMLRLALSSFRDGSGQNVKNHGFQPSARDFERCLAAVVGGRTPENKGIFDVVVATTTDTFGISCKMAKAAPLKSLGSFMELTNAAAQIRAHLLAHQINWIGEPMLAGPAIVDLFSGWHTAAASQLGISLASSRYAILTHDSKWRTFQLQSFPLSLRVRNPRGEVAWSVGLDRKGDPSRLVGTIDDDGRTHLLWQYFANSGGQVKYYPLLTWADWLSAPFELEVPPVASALDKGRLYFKELWPE